MEEENRQETDVDEEERPDSPENEDLRQLILQQLASMESSDLSDEDSYQVRLSCILEDDESESSASQGRSREFPKSDLVAQKMRERDKVERDPPLTGESEESESSDNATMLRDEFAMGNIERVPVTDLDELSLKNSDGDESPSEKTEIQLKTDEGVAEGTEDEEDEDEEVSFRSPFQMRKLKSSDNILAKKLVPKRTEFSSDSSDIDISISNEKPCDVPALSTAEESPDRDCRVEGDSSRDASRTGTESPMFAKISKSYLEKATSGDEGPREDDSDDRLGSVERELLQGQDDPTDPKMILQVVHLRSKSPRVYTPPVPPETYLWEELKRIRGKGGYPWTYLDKPPFDEAAWKKYMEHEYEPVNPPPLSVLRRHEPEERDATAAGVERESGIPVTDEGFARVACEGDALGKPQVEKVEEGPSAAVGEKVGGESASAARQHLQDQMETTFGAQVPAMASTSGADADAAALDSSGLKDVVPLKKSPRIRMRNPAQGIQQKLRNHAGKIKNKFKSLPKPSGRERQRHAGIADKIKFKLPEKAKFSFPERPRLKLPDRTAFSFPERPKLRLPERPKFNLPERPKIHLPERPKFSLPERPKIHLPERPKFNLPERPKFHLPEKAKLHLPERPKFTLPERPKLHLPQRPKLHLPERPKLHLPQRPKIHLPERPKLHLPEMSKFHLSERPKISLPHFRKPLREQQQTASPKNIFEFDLKSYPKIFTKKSKERDEYATSSPKKTRGITPPPKMRTDEPSAPERKKVPVGQRWLKNMDDIKYADEDASVDARNSKRSEDHSESFADLRDKDLEGYMEDLDDSRFPPGGTKTLSTKSSLSHASDRDVESLASSEGKLRKGVLEEIDSDEFFLRQKGISQEDIDMGRYLSHEIRQAFRSPEVNALAKMSFDDDEEMDAENEPVRPKRVIPAKKSNLKKHFESDPALSETAGYMTYPPRKPQRKSRSQSKSLINEDALIADTGPTYENEGMQRYLDDDDMSEYYKTPGPAKEYQHYKVPRPIVEPEPVPCKRKKAWKKKLHDSYSTETPEIEAPPPQPLVRRKSKKKLQQRTDSFRDEVLPKDDEVAFEEDIERVSLPNAASPINEDVMQEFRGDDYALPHERDRSPEDAPVPPRRTRSLSRSMRSSKSLRSVESSGEASASLEPRFERVELPSETQSLTQVEITRPRHYDTMEEDPGFGYATIGKPTVTKPQRQKKEKPARPPPPRRKKDITSLFHTVPRRTPVRPMRNYSTLGPSRPPRRSRTQSKTSLDKSYVELDTEIQPLRYEECHGSNKDLQKEEVIEKMKGRPLPPPPRPPRQKSRGPDDLPEVEETVQAKISMALLKGEAHPPDVEDAVLSQPTAAEPVEEVCAATQTDPLPDDFLLDVEEDVIQEFSHEQLKIQQAFLERMRMDSEMRDRPGDAEFGREPSPEAERRRADKLEMELLAQLRMEADTERKDAKQTEEATPFDVDLGYASLDRKQHKQEPSASAAAPEATRPPEVSDFSANANVLRANKLEATEAELAALNVGEVKAQEMRANDLHVDRVTAREVVTTSGNLTLGNIQLPPSFIQEIVDKIPWENLRPPPSGTARPDETRSVAPAGSPSASPGRDAPFLTPPPRRHRRHRRDRSSSDEDNFPDDDERPHRRHGTRGHPPGVTELTRQLATACAASGVRAMQGIASRIRACQMEDKALLMRVVLCTLVILVAGVLLMGAEPKTVHHHWDFQFPPQPPPHQF